MNDAKIAERFAKDTAEHTLEVLLDQGVYRHLKCTRNGSSVYRFDLTTWPGHLCVSGDMGTYVFSRLPDMFEFFRSDRGGINPGYWSEKLQAPLRSGSDQVVEFSREKFDETLKTYRDDYVESEGLDEFAIESLDAALEDAFSGVSSVEEAFHAVQSFEEMPMDDFYEHDLTDWSGRFIWICHAIVWAISRYDAMRKAA